ncbi:uncharacterized protein [Phyllobates terribilis]|uniref:uncharacterized protein n=1 Tax=Phyllobates terribilis TaxID=111132 RepID=UPI003CCA7A3B
MEIEAPEREIGESEPSKLVVPKWKDQITLRGVIVSIILGSIYSIISMRFSLTTGIGINLNVSTGLTAFVAIRSWTKLMENIGFSVAPFTKQENTMIQTCAVACYTIAQSGGFGSYLLGLNKKTYEMAGIGTQGNPPGSYKEPGFGWMTSYLFLVCFIGLFVLVPLRKILIVDYKLAFPSGMATAVLINGFHSQGDKTSKKQVKSFAKIFSMSFLWGFFKWFYSGKNNCGFSQFPTFGLQAWRQTFYFDYSMSYVGTGMICAHIVNLSLLLGAVLSWGLMWPLISNHEGKWYPDNLPDESMKSLNGYKVFVAIALIFGDGLYNFIKVAIVMVKNIQDKRKVKNPEEGDSGVRDENKKQDELFIQESIPMWVATSGYVTLSIITTIALPMMFPQVKWYYVVVAYLLTPPLAFCNAYGAGLTDMNMSYNYGKVALFTLGALAGKDSGLVTGMIGCGLIKSVVSVSCTLMQDLKAGHLTLSSPISLLVSQAIGTFFGCIVAPLSFFLFYNAFDVGNPNGEFKAPFAIIYRNMAILGVEGFGALPQHCLQLCYGFFAFAIVINLVRDFSPTRVGKWIPIPMVMAAPFLVGAYFAIDMCVGSLIVFVWQMIDAKKVELMVPAVASGLICGEGLWSLPDSLLALAKVKPPICMKFFAS